jgi:hypothetical protein
LSLEWEWNPAAAASPELKNRDRILRQQAQVNTVASFRRLVAFLARQLRRFVVSEYQLTQRNEAVQQLAFVTPVVACVDLLLDRSTFGHGAGNFRA